MFKSLFTDQQLFVRIAGGLGVTALGIFLLGLIPFIGTEPSAGAALPRTPSVSVNREFKGDKLPLTSHNSAVSRVEPSFLLSAKSHEIPVGCDPAFSPVSAPRLAYYFGRCTT
ncbi:MAG TPA: hypothetical protein VGH13_08910 [Xanthobacteraceae bacterium]|jgi:hypothetical protein